MPVENPMTGAIPSSGTISVPPLTESDLIKPVQRQSHGDVNKAIANAFAQTGNGVSLRGLNWFCTSELFSDRTFKDYLQNLDRDTFIKRLCYYMAELNVLHPFREGNGRTIREFIRQLAYKNGYVLNLKHINPKEMLYACIRSVVDTTQLETIISECLEKEE